MINFLKPHNQSISSLPATCLLCQNTLEDQITLIDILSFRRLVLPTFCQGCMHGFNKITGEVCQQCGRPKVDFEADNQLSKICSDCQRWRHFHNWTFNNHALYHYNDTFSDWLIILKGQGDIRGRHLFNKDLQKMYQKYPQAIWVPLPSSSEKGKNWGFNQTSLLLASAQIPYLDLLESKGNGQKQAYKSRRDRLKDMNKIQLKTTTERLNKNQLIILFDDVYTTGTTMYAAFKALEAEGFEHIMGITLAR